MWGWRSIGFCIIFCLSLADADGGFTVLTDKEKRCSFPFRYNNVLYNDCRYEGSPGRAWCSLTPNFDKDKEYGWCDATVSPKMETNGGTANGAVCRFPFIYDGKEYKYCLQQSSVPWCATTSSYDRDKIWGYCNGRMPKKVPAGRVTVKTDKAKPCSFPYIYSGVLNYDCLHEGSPGRAWCSLTPNFDKDKTYGWCDATASPKMETYGGNANGNVCRFPFILDGKEYKYCVVQSSVPWCATTSSYDRDKIWGYCNGYTPENQFRPFSPIHVGVHSFGDAEAVGSSTRTTIVQIHNKLRNDVSPTATNMLKMSYDVELENLARKWVNQCKGGHPEVYNLPGKASSGQNVFSSTALSTSWGTAIMSWYNETKHFTYGTHSTSGVTGHYTQVVWADTSLVGCAMKKCGAEKHYLYACNYGPSGNFSPAYKPYIKGDAGSSCMNRDSTYTNLCDCGGQNICLNNGGAVDTKTCTCNCKEGQVGSRCAIDCGAFKDAWYCPTSYGVKSCTISNVPFECPKMCGVCP